ncbi:MAG: hypothetical protein FWF66_00265 [Candidatus Bathyarchaeota archaeon]|nr:hypothetical protein [Candidatus Termiticorpusculum sp.]
MKISKKIWTILSITVMLSAFLSIQTFNDVHAEPAYDEYKEKMLTAIQNVVGIDVDKYSVQVHSYGFNPFKEVKTPTYDMTLNLTSQENQLFASALFKNDYMIHFDVDVIKGSPSTIHYSNETSTDLLIATKETLSRLYTVTSNPIIVDMQKILETAKDIDTANKTVGNIECRVPIYMDPLNPSEKSQFVEVYFIYTLNGAESPKLIAVHFDDNRLKGFSDTWNLYSVGSADVKITKEQAVNMAREHAINSTSESLTFPSDRSIVTELYMVTRGEDFVLYPFWFVEVPLVYPIDVSIYGWQEGIWADTGEIQYGHPVGGYGVMPEPSDPSNNATSQNAVNPFLVAGIIATVAIVGLIATIAVLKKR